ncbi:MAG: PGPGW domain-containing protein [Proteobacteria bacterium]|nr:PGPGW domain-containing protein [Pseudomonadota bacterium]MBU1057795.1 PGPGW domain-containing protein [Pseudomonadota bacterium]
MNTLFSEYRPIFKVLGLISTLTFFLSLLIIPWIICRLPSDFFRHLRDHKKKEDQHPLMMILLRLLRNFLGAILLLAGILMLFLPGQGILTIILGIGLLDFPGKRRAKEAFVRRHSVHTGLNWIRDKGGKPRFSFDHED